MQDWLNLTAEISDATRIGRPVVALESTLIAHGLPWPLNYETAVESEHAIRSVGAIPATIAVLRGQPTVGLSTAEIEALAKNSAGVVKASRRDLATAIGLGQTAATTVSATMTLAALAGIQVFATGGIGGAHRESDFDISADLTELARTPVVVVCSGAKSILDLPRTLEILETLAVPVLGYRSDGFPTFYTAGTIGRVSARVETPNEVAAVVRAHWRMGGGGVVVAQPCPADVAVPETLFDRALTQAELDASAERISGPALTPFLLSRVAELTDGRTLAANRSLIVQNAKLAAEIALAMLESGTEVKKG